MSKKKRKSFRRMDKQLFRMMKVARKSDPVSACAACCATLAILYKGLDEDGREAMSPVIARCIDMITGDQKQPGGRVH